MSPEYDALLDSYYGSIPQADRIAALRRIVHTLSDEMVFMGLSYTLSVTLVGSRLHNVTGPALRSVTGWNTLNWDVE